MSATGSPSGDWAPIVRAALRSVPTYETEVDLVAVSRVASCSTRADWEAGTLSSVTVNDRGEVSLVPSGVGLTLLDTTTGSPTIVSEPLASGNGIMQSFTVDIWVDPASVSGQPFTLGSLTFFMDRRFTGLPFLDFFTVTVGTYDDQWRFVPLGDPVTITRATDNPYPTGVVTIDFPQNYGRQFIIEPGALRARTGPGINAVGALRSVDEVGGLSTITAPRALSIEISASGRNVGGAAIGVISSAPAFDTNAFWRVRTGRFQGPYRAASPPLSPAADVNLDGLLATGAVPGYGARATGIDGGLWGTARRVASDTIQQRNSPWRQPYAKVTARTVAPSGSAVVVLDMGAVPTNPVQFRADDWVRRGTALTYSLRGRNLTTDAWTTIGAVVDGGAVPALFRYYEVTATFTATIATGGAALISPVLQAVQITERITYRTEGLTGEVDSDASVDPVTGQSSIGELVLPLMRGPRDDFRDLATTIGAGVSPSRLEAHVYGVCTSTGARKFLDAYRLESRVPSRDREEFRFVSGLDRLQVRIPPQVETYTLPGPGGVFPTISGITGSGGSRTLTISGATWAPGQLTGYRLRMVNGDASGVDYAITAAPGVNTITITVPPSGVLPNNGDALEVHSDVYRRVDVVYTGVDPAVVYEDVLITQARVPRRLIGALPPLGRVRDAAGAVLTTSGRLKASEGADGVTALSVLQALAALMGGAVVWRRGLITFVDLMTPRESVATWDERDYATLDTPTGLDRRMPSVSCKYGADATTGTYAGEVIANDLSVIAAAGRANLFDVTAVDDAIATWCTTQALATAHVTRLRDAFASGVPVWSVSLIYPHPWIDLGDVVTIVTEQYTTRIFRFSPDGLVDESLPISGRTATVGVVIGRNLQADRFAVLARSTTPVVGGSVGGGPTDGPLGGITVPVITLTALRGGVGVTYTPPSSPYFARMEYDVRSRVTAGPGAWSVTRRVVGAAAGTDFVPFTPDVSSDVEITPITVSVGDERVVGTPAAVTVTVSGGVGGGEEPFVSVSLAANTGSNTFVPTFTLASAIAGASVTASIRRVWGGVDADVPGVVGTENYTGVTSGGGLAPGSFTLAPFASGSTTTYTATIALNAFIGSTMVGSAVTSAVFYVDNTGA
jgi:hypothetical protein